MPRFSPEGAIDDNEQIVSRRSLLHNQRRSIWPEDELGSGSVLFALPKSNRVSLSLSSFDTFSATTI